MKDKILKRARVIVGIIIIVLISWIFIVKPKINFIRDENTFMKAAQRYFELNSSELPSGERVKTLPLQKVYDAGLLEKDFYIPFSKKTCSNENSWVKVRRENGEYKYYTYLECGYLKSTVDHEGPQIILNGKEEITINRNTKYKELGVKEVNDKVDGSLKVSDVSIRGNVDTSKTGTYEITYTAFDKLNNKAVVTRKVNVVRKIYDSVKNDLEDDTNYKGDPDYNYVRLSNMMFRIYGYDKNKNVILVANEDIANVNYTKVDNWLEYYYDNLNDKTKSLIVEKKYCQMTLEENNLNTKKCEKYTENKKVFIPSIADINKVEEDEMNFMKPTTISWTADKKDEKTAYVTRDVWFGREEGKVYPALKSTDNFGVRPMFTIKGDTLIKGGEGTTDKPYTFGDVKRAKGGSLINERFTGEYLNIDGTVFRIIKAESDGTTKVISDTIIGGYDGLTTFADPSTEVITYNPKNKKSVAYFINNQTTKYVDNRYFVNHTIEVPIYEKEIIYGKEKEIKKYVVLFSAPNMYEMFSAQSMQSPFGGSYWLSNTSKAKGVGAAIQDLGVPMDEKIEKYDEFGVRIVAFLRKDTILTSGKGTSQHPYNIK